MAIKFLNAQEVEATLGKGTQVLNFYADWCGPCKMMAPSLEELSSEVEVIKVNTDENRDLAMKYGVQGLPTTFILKEGKVVDSIVGFAPLEVIKAKI